MITDDSESINLHKARAFLAHHFGTYSSTVEFVGDDHLVYNAFTESSEVLSETAERMKTLTVNWGERTY